MNRWYRAYEGTVSDPKLHEVALDAGVSRSVVLATWQAILESCASNESSKIEITPRRISLVLAEEKASIERVFESLEALGMITENTVSKWDERQFSTDTSRQRTREYREKKRMSQESHRDVTVTSQKRHGDAPETETETETENTHTGRELEIVPANLPDENFVALRNAFQSKNLLWPNPAKETQALKQLCTLANQAGDAPETLHRLTEDFWRRKNSRDAFWSRQPFVPSRMLALWNDLQAGQPEDLTKLDPAFEEALK